MVLKGIKKGELCEVHKCYNQAYGFNNITPFVKEKVCRRHYYDSNYGITNYNNR